MNFQAVLGRLSEFLPAMNFGRMAVIVVRIRVSRCTDFAHLMVKMVRMRLVRIRNGRREVLIRIERVVFLMVAVIPVWTPFRLVAVLICVVTKPRGYDRSGL